MIKEKITKVVEGSDLSFDEAFQVMTEIMDGKTTDAQIATILTALRLKKETPDEISGFAKAMRDHAVKVDTGVELLVDTCGTGGDKTGTFNISTVSAFVAAGAGVKIAKHGNRSVSSATGSADVLEALGVKLDIGPDAVRECIKQVGIGFMFAPGFHPAMKHAIGPRKEMGIRTAFNILGPLTNPAGASAQVLGVYDENLTEVLAEVLKKLGSKHALVVHGAPGLDELSTLGESKVSELKDGQINNYTVTPEEVGLPKANLDDLKGGDPAKNAKILKDILDGEKGPKRDIVLLNTAAATVVADKANDLKEGIAIAKKSIDSGEAKDKLNGLIELSNKL